MTFNSVHLKKNVAGYICIYMLYILIIYYSQESVAVLITYSLEHFGYADDIVLIAPSAEALKIMISICEAYAYEFSILFNPRKSKLMCFNVNADNLDITLCQCCKLGSFRMRENLFF